MKCPHCLTDAGRTTKGAECCELRELSNGPRRNFEAPPSHDQERLRPLVNAEKIRLNSIRKNKFAKRG